MMHLLYPNRREYELAFWDMMKDLRAIYAPYHVTGQANQALYRAMQFPN